MTPFRETLRGIVAISACNLLFLINDTMIKLANSEMPLGELLFLRGIFATTLLVPIVIWTGAHRRVGMLWNRWLLLRLIAEVFGAVLFLVALFKIPIANVNAILQVVPLMVTACAAVFLGDEVGWRRWLAIAIGFLGVLIVIRPGFSGFNVFSLVALASMVFIIRRCRTCSSSSESTAWTSCRESAPPCTNSLSRTMVLKSAGSPAGACLLSFLPMCIPRCTPVVSAAPARRGTGFRELP